MKPAMPSGFPAVQDPSVDQGHAHRIERSHLRCAQAGLSQFERPEHAPLSLPDLQLVRERNHRLYHHAAPVMELLFDQIARSHSMVVLTDAQGTILHAIGDDDFLARADQVALKPGVNWAEHAKGTNAIGTALIDEQPTLVHADEHFLHANHFLTCSAAPIVDPRGNLLGILDVTGDHRSYHRHTMGLVRMSVCMIEHHWFQDDFRDVLRLHFHARVQALGSLLACMIAIGHDGRLLGANRAALQVLGLSTAALRLHDVESLLGLGVDTLVDQATRGADPRFSLRLPDGRLVAAQVHFNWPLRAATPPRFPTSQPESDAVARPVLPGGGAGTQDAARTPVSLRELEIDAIRQAVADAGGNISAAARRLGVSRNTIYRRLQAQAKASPAPD